MHAKTLTSPPAAVLWIDDDRYVTENGKSFLPAHGLRVTMAATVDEGRCAALTSNFLVILLELLSPGDRDGVDLLAEVSGRPGGAPVVVLTGHDRPEWQATATKLGARGYYRKPLVGRALLDAITLASGERALACQALAASVDAVAGQIEHAVDARHGVRHGAVRAADRESRRHDGTSARLGWHPALTAVLLHPLVTVPLFMSCAAAFRHAVTRPSEPPPKGLADVIRRAATYTGPKDKRVATCLARLSAAGLACGKVHLNEVAADANVDSAHLGRLVAKEAGLGFVDWKHGIRLRRAVRLLVETDRPIQNIAGESGFEGLQGAAHFADVFHRIFGTAPTTFQRLVRGMPRGRAGAPSAQGRT